MVEGSRVSHHDRLEIANVVGFPGGTVKKYLLRTHDDLRVEAVSIQHDDHVSLCVSSQVGCKMACGFCSTGLAGFTRDMTRSEIVDQVVLLASHLESLDGLEVAFMGMGEPLDNFEAVLGAIEILRQEFPGADLCLSTIGIPGRIEDLARFAPDVRLQVSVHSTDLDTRRLLMPIERRYPLPEVMASVRRWTEIARKRATLNYTLMAGVNDSERNARALAGWYLALPEDSFSLKVSDYNPTTGQFQPVSPECRDRFISQVSAFGVPVRSFGSSGVDVEAGCGQLAHRERQTRASLRGART